MSIELRTEQHQIKPSNSIYKLIDKLCTSSKNIYNKALYEQRQYYMKFNKFMSYTQLYNLIKTEDCFKTLPCVLGQQVLRQVATICDCFVKATISYYKDSSRFICGKPRLPKYKPADGRFKISFPFTAFRLYGDTIHFHKVLGDFTIKTKHRYLCSIQIVPRKGIYIIDVIYYHEDKIKDTSDLKYIAAIDLGVDNFSTMTVWNNTSRPMIINGKGLKSYNKQFNKILAQLKSEAMIKNKMYTTKKIYRLYQKRNNYMQTWMHKASRLTVDYLIENKVGAVVIGHNSGWKQNSKLSKKVNQTFIQIPYSQYIKYVTYKAQEAGIEVYVVNEAYTSGTSFLDNEQPTKENYNKSRRIYRGLFKSNSGQLINSDVNASYQIAKKAVPQLMMYKDKLTKEQLHNKLNPVRVNVA